MNVDGLVLVTPPCPHCMGKGRTYGPSVVRGGQHSNDMKWTPCESCNGTGHGPSRLEWRCPTCTWTQAMDNAERKAGLHVRPSGPCPDSNHKIHGRVVRLVDLEELAFVGGDVQMGAYTIVAEWTP